MKQITELTTDIFQNLLTQLKILKLDSDNKTFDEIKYRLNNNIILTPEEFAYECFYVVCVAGFKQDYAKKICNQFIELINNNIEFTFDNIFIIFKNKLKIKALLNIWQNKHEYHNTYYNKKSIDDKINFLGTLPYIGNITKYHLARNLGLNFVKYDIWIQRLGVALYGDINIVNNISNSKLSSDVKLCCDKMFNNLHNLTHEKIGFIDVVLWRSCQKGLIQIENTKIFLLI